MMASGSRNNVLAGIFVVASILLGTLAIVLLSNIGDAFKAQNDYTVRFTIADGADGLDEGAPVKLGGKRVGRVLGSQFVNNETSGDPEFIDVSIEIEKSVRLFSDADVQLIRPLLGSGSSINIVSFGGHPPESDTLHLPPHLLAPGATIMGRQGAPGFLSQSDYTKMQDILSRVDRITADVEPRVGPLIEDAKASLANVRSITEDAREQWKNWSVRISDVLARVDTASEQFEPIATGARAAIDKINSRIDETAEVFASVRNVINDNRQKVNDIIENVRELSAKAKGEAYDKVLAVLDQAKAGLDAATSAAREADALVARNSPAITDIITNGALAANQMRLATVEVRAAPWRLLYQPTKKELENELLYNSVRQYSDAVLQLRLASDNLRATSARPGVSEAELDAMGVKLKEAFDQYQKEEKAFMGRWVEAK